MKALHILSIAFLAFSFLLPGFFPGRAYAASATLRVTATIRPWMQFSARQQRAFYRVTAQDIRKGYIDLPQALSVHLRTNIQDTIQLDLVNEGRERILVSEAGVGSFHSAQDGLNIRAPSPGAPVTKNLDLRIVLSAGTKEGIHPLQVTMTPQAL